MNKWNWMQLSTVSILFLALVLLILRSNTDLLNILTLAIIAICLILWKWIELKIRDFEIKANKSKNEKKLIEILNHYRHDSLNNIQVLLSYIKLKKYDKLELYMDKLKGELEQESLISRLEISSLVLYLTILRTQHHIFELEVSMDPGIQLSKQLDKPDEISRIVSETIDIIKNTVQVSHDIINQLDLHISVNLYAIVFTINYDGKLLVEECELALKSKHYEINNNNLIQIKSEINGMKAFVEISVLHHS